MVRMKPTEKMLDAITETIERLLASGTPPYGVACIVWDLVSAHTQMLQESSKGNKDTEGL